MKFRVLATASLAGVLAFSLSGADAATRSMDGKKVKVLTLTADGGLQDNDKDITSTNSDRVSCSAPRCARLPFVYKPAKGVAGGLMLTVTWSKPVSDIDLYLGEVGKHGFVTEVGSCGSSGSTQEKVYVGPSDLRSGRTYVMIVDFYRSLNETANAKVEINVPSTITQTLPKAVDDVALFNCAH